MKVTVFLADGFELVEAMCPIDMLRRAGADVMTVGIGASFTVESANGVSVVADMLLSDMPTELPDLVLLPGGMPGAANLRACPAVCQTVTDTAANGGYVAAICAAPFVLGELGLLNGKEAICYPGFEDKLLGATVSDKKVVRDGKIITAAGMGVALPFAAALIDALYGKEKADEVLASVIAE